MAATKKPSKAPPASAKPKTGKKPAAAKKPAPKPAPKQTARPAAKKPAAAASKTVPRKPLPEAVIPIPGTAPNVPAQIVAFLEKFDALKAGKTWAVKAAALIEKIPAALFGEFEDALDLETPLSTGKIPLHLIDPKTAKTAAAKTGKGTIPAPRPSPKTFGTAILGNKIGREELVELVERLRWCLCCCHCWPCRPWPFCRICRWRLVKVSSTVDSGWVYHLNFKNASAAIADRVAEITCPSGGSSGGPWAPQVWNASTPAAEVPVGYAEAGHDHDGDYAATGHNHDAAYAPKQKGGADIKYAEIDAPVGQTVKLRDKATSPSPADVTVSLSGHNHDTAYAAAGHNHDTAYAAAGHNHNTVYAAAGHNHDSSYAAAGHNHDSAYAAASHVHRKTQAGRLENPASAAGGLVTVNLSNLTGVILANIRVHATAFGRKTGAHFPMYVTNVTIGGTTTSPTATFTVQHADGTAYDSTDTTTWGSNAKMVLSFVATENF